MSDQSVAPARTLTRKFQFRRPHPSDRSPDQPEPGQQPEPGRAAGAGKAARTPPPSARRPSSGLSTAPATRPKGEPTPQKPTPPARRGQVWPQPAAGGNQAGAHRPAQAADRADAPLGVQPHRTRPVRAARSRTRKPATSNTQRASNTQNSATGQPVRNYRPHAPYAQPPSRMSEQAKAEWHATPESVRGDVDRMTRSSSRPTGSTRATSTRCPRSAISTRWRRITAPTCTPR